MQKIETPDILYYKWAVQNPDAVFLLVHGMGAHSGRWGFLADWFLKQNISSYSLELKGFGEAPGVRGHIDSLSIYYRDILKLADKIREENPGKKVMLLAESMGGLIAFMTAALYPGSFDGLIAISPAFANGMKISPLTMLDMVTAMLYNQKKQFKMPFNAQMCTVDGEYRKVMDADPREHRFATSRLLWEILVAQLKSGFVKDKIKIPVLFLFAGKDYLVNTGPGIKMFKSLKTDRKKMIEYPEMQHALSIEKDRDKVFSDILEWISSVR